MSDLTWMTIEGKHVLDGLPSSENYFFLLSVTQEDSSSFPPYAPYWEVESSIMSRTGEVMSSDKSNVSCDGIEYMRSHAVTLFMDFVVKVSGSYSYGEKSMQKVLDELETARQAHGTWAVEYDMPNLVKVYKFVGLPSTDKFSVSLNVSEHLTGDGDTIRRGTKKFNMKIVSHGTVLYDQSLRMLLPYEKPLDEAFKMAYDHMIEILEMLEQESSDTSFKLAETLCELEHTYGKRNRT